MKVAYLQTSPAFGKLEANVARAETLVLRAAERGATLVVLPELYSTGYQFKSKKEALSLSEKPGEGPGSTSLIALAKSRRIHIVAGFAERGTQKRVYNSAVLVGPRGIISIYRKAHLFANEKKIFDPGNTPFGVYKVGRARVGMMICFDWLFPEAARTLALKGADVIAHPSNLVLPHCPEAMRTRCLENRVFAITANRIGTEKRRKREKLEFIGNSQVVSPGGKVLKRARSDKETIGVVEIDLRKARSKKITPTNDIIKDRRRGLYEL